jgi:CBS-domain-containing membrane protein
MALRQQNLVVAASLAATAFTVFAMPSSVTARTRNVIGGHLIGIVCGSLFALFQLDFFAEREAYYALAVGCSMFLMTITNTEHPPAAGTALGMVIAGFSWRLGLGALIGVSLLSTIHRLMRPWLIDLILPPELSQPNPGDR